MDFISGIVNAAKGLWSWFTGNSAIASLAQTALTAWGVSQLSQSTTKENTETTASTTNQVDIGVRLQVDPDPDHKIPVVYGEAYLGGIVTDAQITNSNKTMWYCITICERTGIKLSDNQASQIQFEDIFWNDQRLVFNTGDQSDYGVLVDYSVDRDGNVDYSLQGQVRVYCFSGGKNVLNLPQNVMPDNYRQYAGDTGPFQAFELMPGWGASYAMDNLAFALIRVDYNKDKGVTGLGDIKFHIKNTMTLPGDCIYDYMTNEIYGAGIAPEEIYSA